MNGNLALVNARITNPWSVEPVAEAVLARRGTIEALGRSEEIIRRARSQKVEVLDLAGRPVFPGFIDSHLHAMATGMAESGTDLYDCRNISEVLERLGAAAADTPLGDWVVGQRLDEALITEGRPPTRDELDRIGHGRPIFIEDRGLHYAVLNTPALATLAIDTTDLAGGGPDTGRLQEAASGLARRRLGAALPRERRVQALHRAADRFVRAGLTSIHAIEGGELFHDDDARLLLEIVDDLPLHVVLYWSTDDVLAVRDAGLPRIGGDICIDGSIGSRTAAFTDPYADDPSTTGRILRDEDEVVSLLIQTEAAGMQLSMHAIGERAIALYLDAIEHAGADPRRFRHRIDHFGVPTEADITRAARLGVTVPTQPAFPFLRGGPGSIYARRLGPERDRRAYPLRSLVDAGVIVGGGSDSPVVPGEPLLGLHSCVNHPYPEQRLRPLEALRIYTVNNAYLAFEEDLRGTIEVGRSADLVCLDQSPLEVPPDRIRDLNVLLTVSRGVAVYDSGQLHNQEVVVT